MQLQAKPESLLLNRLELPQLNLPGAVAVQLDR